MTTEREQLTRIIQQWNENRLDLFALTFPNEDLEFFGVMRFYFSEQGARVATKCLRVSSTATTRAVIDALVEKFHPDLRMLTTPQYSLWEIHENGEERQLALDEKPLLVQLNWHKDDREGRFLLKRQGETNLTLQQMQKEDQEPIQMKRKLSKREKKELKKIEKQKQARKIREAEDIAAEKLYSEVPQTSFTRTISNPEIVMKKRRERKLEQRLKEMGDNPQDAGGSLKIYGQSLSGSKPYVTLLVSVSDNAYKMVKETLEKYGMEKEDPANFCLFEVVIPASEGNENIQPNAVIPLRERMLQEDECPLMILTRQLASKEQIVFHVRQRNADLHKRPASRNLANGDTAHLPYIVELNSDGSALSGQPRIYSLLPNVTEVGSDRALSNSVQTISLYGPYIHPKHCIIAFIDGIVTITPCSPNAEVQVNGFPITETAILHSGCVVRIGRSHMFRFSEPDAMVSSYVSRADAAVNVLKDHNQSMPVRSNNMATGFTTTRTAVLDSASKLYQQQYSSLITPSSEALDVVAFETTFDVDGRIETISLAGDVTPVPIPPLQNVEALARSRSTSVSTITATTRDLSSNFFINKQRTVTSSTSSISSPSAYVDSEHLQVRSFLENFRTGTGSGAQYIEAPLAKAEADEEPEEQPVDYKAHNNYVDVRDPCQYAHKLRVDVHQTPGGMTSSQATLPEYQNRQQQIQISRDVVPAVVDLRDGAEDAFMTSVIRDADASKMTFKLGPAYLVYMVARCRMSQQRSGFHASERGVRLSAFLSRIADMLHVTIQDHCHDAGSLAFWMANSSELLNFMKSDSELCSVTYPEPQESIGDAVQKSFGHLAACLCKDLHQTLPLILEQTADDDSASKPCLRMLSSAMILLRQCKVNAALTIQLFSQLFHHINMVLFNWFISPQGSSYCSRFWGACINRRLSYVLAWAEKQGLELAANCHLSRITQAAQLLESRKTSTEDLASLSSSCFKLNSVQIRALLENYQPEAGVEPPIPAELLENLVKVAEGTADEMARSDGRMICAQEEAELHLPFLLPEDGYSPDLIRGVPQGLQEFADALAQNGICQMILQPSASQSWTVHMGVSGTTYETEQVATPALMPQPSDFINKLPGSANAPKQQQQQQLSDKIATIVFNRGNSGIGLSIVAAQGNNQRALGIYVKKVVRGSIAEKDGRIQAGDQLLACNGSSLTGITQEVAADIMAHAGPLVRFEVARQAALFNGLAFLLDQPSPPPVHKAMLPASNGMHGPERVKSEEVLTAETNARDVSHHRSSPAVNGGQRFPSQPQLAQRPSHNSVHHQQLSNEAAMYTSQTPAASYATASASGNNSNLGQDLPMHQQQSAFDLRQRATQQQLPTTHHSRSLSATNLREDRTLPARVQPPSYGSNEQRMQTHQQQEPPAEIKLPEQRNSHEAYPADGTAYGTQPHGSMVYNRYGAIPSLVESQYQNLGQYQSQVQHQLMSNGQGSHHQRPTSAAFSYTAGGAHVPIVQRPQSNSYALEPSSVQHLSQSSSYNMQQQRHPDFEHPVQQQHRVLQNQSRNSVPYCASPAPGGRIPVRPDYPGAPNVSNVVQYVPHTAGRIVVPPNSLHVQSGTGSVRSDRSPYAAHPPPYVPQNAYNSEMGPSSSMSSLSSAAAFRDQNSRYSATSPVGLPHQQRRVISEAAPIYRAVPYQPAQNNVERISSPAVAAQASAMAYQYRMGSPTVSSSPWEKEDKLRMQAQIMKEVEEMVDAEIESLETKGSLLQDEEDRLNALRLERAFQNRLKEADQEEEEVGLEEDARSPSSALPMAELAKVINDDLERKKRREADRQAAQDREVLERKEMRERCFAAAEEKIRKLTEDQRRRREQQLHAVDASSMEKPVSTNIPSQYQHSYEPVFQQQMSSLNINREGARPPQTYPKTVKFDANSADIVPVSNNGTYETNSGANPMQSNAPAPTWDNVQKKYIYETEATPKVIGAQEVYRDPYKRKLEEQKGSVNVWAEGEKLSFSEKMKLFAKTVGEDAPKNKLKVSSAQREIELSLSTPQR